MLGLMFQFRAIMQFSAKEEKKYNNKEDTVRGPASY